MDTFERRADRLSSLGLVLLVAGMGVLVVQTWIAYMSAPGSGLLDGYAARREPWSSGGIMLYLAGTTLSVVTGALLVLIRGDWLRRLAVLAFLALPALWWGIALSLVAYPGLSSSDPVTLAFAYPLQAILLLLLPAVAVNVLGVTPVRREPRVRFRPVHPEPRPAFNRRAARRSAPDSST